MSVTSIEMLKQEFVDRKERRPQYSERAFARDLGLSAGFISLLFNHKRSLSPTMALKISQLLNWSESKSDAFIASVQQAKLSTRKSGDFPKDEDLIEELKYDQFRLISNVRHFAVLEFVENRKKATVEKICDYFSIGSAECEIILYRLTRLKMVRQQGNIYVAEPKKRKLKSVPSEAIRSHHSQCLDLAQKALVEQSFEEREFRSLTLSLDPKKIETAKKEMERFLSSFSKKYSTQSRGEVYQVNMQLFTHKGGPS